MNSLIWLFYFYCKSKADTLPWILNVRFFPLSGFLKYTLAGHVKLFLWECSSGGKDKDHCLQISEWLSDNVTIWARKSDGKLPEYLFLTFLRHLFPDKDKLYLGSLQTITCRTRPDGCRKIIILHACTNVNTVIYIKKLCLVNAILYRLPSCCMI